MALKRRVDPPRTNAKLHIDQAWYRLQENIEDQLNDVGFSGVLWVDQADGDDQTAVRGSLTFKYETIQAALDAAEAGDTVWVSPGIYVEDIVWPDTDTLSLRGMGVLSTAIINATAVDTVQIVPGLTLTGAEISNMSIANDGADRSLNVVGSADPDMFMDRVLYLHDLVFTNNVRIEVANEIDFRNIEAKDAALLLLNTGRTNMRGCRWDAITDTYEDAPAVPPSLGPLAFAATSTIVDAALTVNGLGMVAFGEDTQVGSVVGVLTDSATGAGTIWMSGRVIGTVGITFNYDVTYHECCRFDYAQIGDAVSVAGVTGVQRGLAKFRHAELLDTDGIHTSGNLCDMDLRGALYPIGAALVVAGDGTIDQSIVYLTQAINAGGGAVGVPITPPLPVSAASNYYVTSELAVAADVCAISNKQNTSFDRTCAGGDNTGAIQFLLHRPFD